MSDLATKKEVVGGWTAYHKLTPNDQEVFNQAMEGFVGVKYVPQTVSTQVVAGTNYRFKCEASLPQGGASWEAIVDIFAPLKGKPFITGIHRV